MITADPRAEQFFEDEGVLTIFASNLNEVCVAVEQGMNPGYAAFTTKKARAIAMAILSMTDAIEASREGPRMEMLRSAYKLNEWLDKQSVILPDDPDMSISVPADLLRAVRKSFDGDEDA